jgi:hypothetical protein
VIRRSRSQLTKINTSGYNPIERIKVDTIKLSDMEIESVRNLIGNIEASHFKLESYIRRVLISSGIQGDERFGLSADCTALIKQEPPEADSGVAV